MTDDRLDPTNRTDSIDPLDELASAHLDGVTTPEEASRVASDPDLAARVAAFAAVRAAVGADTGPVDVDRKEQALAAALGALDPTATAGPGTPIGSLADAARRRSNRRRMQLVGVAAAVAIAVAVVPVLARHRDRSADRVAAAAGSTTTALAAGKQAAPREAADSGAAGQTMTALAAPPVALGPFPDLSSLAAVARAQLASASSTTTAPVGTGGTAGSDTPAAAMPAPPDAATQTCLDAAQQAATDAGQVVVLSGTATLGERSVAVVVTEAPDGHRVLTATDPAAGCTVVGSETL
jgi:hypothetical protein